MPTQIKVVIVGDGAIGKSCLVDAIKDPSKEMSTEYQPTVADNQTLDWTDADGMPVKCDFWDTAGQEQFSQLRTIAYNNAQVVVVGFKMTEPNTLENIVEPKSGWVQEVQQKMEGFEEWILCGTQADLWNPEDPTHCQESRIFEIAEEISAKQVIYTSAFTKKNCEHMQQEICRIGVDVQKGNPVPNWEKPAPPAPAPAPAPAPGGASASDSAPAPAPAAAGEQKKTDSKPADEGCKCTLL